MGAERRRMGSAQHAVATGVDMLALALSLGAPQHEDDRSFTLGKKLDHAVRKALPAPTLMCTRLASLDREHRVKQQHSATCPGTQATVIRSGHGEVVV